MERHFFSVFHLHQDRPFQNIDESTRIVAMHWVGAAGRIVHKPSLLVLWGRYDNSFTIAGGEAYKRMTPKRRYASWMPGTSRWI